MYLEGKKSTYTYENKSRSYGKHTNVFLILSILIISLFLSFFIVQQVNSRIYNSYIVSAKEIKNIELKDVNLNQDTINRLFIDSEFYKGEELSVIDKRIFVFEKYFEANNSPLVGHGDLFVKACDKYGAPKDCISLVAIAKHETNLCKYHISADMFNCLGWGGGAGSRVTFKSFDQMTDRAIDVLVNQYGVERMKDPTLMEKVFCGPQEECIGWGSRIIKIMDSIDQFAQDLGVGSLRE